MPLTKYTFSVANDFPNQAIDLDCFSDQIRASDITMALDHINLNEDICDVWFKNTLPSEDVTVLNALVAAHDGCADTSETPSDTEGIPLVSMVFTVGSKLATYSHDYTKPETWYQTSTRKTGVTLSTSNNLVFNLSTPEYVVNVTNGLLPDERTLHSTYAPVVYVDGTPQTEQNTVNTTGDYTIAYATGQVVFFDSVTPGAAVTIDYSAAGDSSWSLVPTANKVMRLVEVELQFAVGAELQSAVVFTLYGEVGKDPRLNALWNQNDPPGPYPLGTPIPMSSAVYQNKKDMIAEANKSYPVIPKDVNSGPRGLPFDVQIYRWDYARAIPLRDSWGNKIVIQSEGDLPMSGGWGLVTFYGESESE